MIKRVSFVLISAAFLLTVNARGQSNEQKRIEKIDKWYAERLRVYHTKLDPCAVLSVLPDDIRSADDDDELRRCTPVLNELHILEATYNSWKSAKGLAEKCDGPLDAGENMSVGTCKSAATNLTRLTELLYDAIPDSEKS